MDKSEDCLNYAYFKQWLSSARKFEDNLVPKLNALIPYSKGKCDQFIEFWKSEAAKRESKIQDCIQVLQDKLDHSPEDDGLLRKQVIFHLIY